MKNDSAVGFVIDEKAERVASTLKASTRAKVHMAELEGQLDSMTKLNDENCNTYLPARESASVAVSASAVLELNKARKRVAELVDALRILNLDNSKLGADVRRLDDEAGSARERAYNDRLCASEELDTALAKVAELDGSLKRASEAYDELSSGYLERAEKAETRVAELKGVLRTLHDCIDREMGDSDLDGDPLVEAMGAAMRLLLPTPKGGDKVRE